MNTIPEKFDITAQRFPKRPCLYSKAFGSYAPITFKGMKWRITETARGLFELGVRQGDRVAILSENSEAWVRLDIATLRLGGIVVPVHTTVSPTIIKHILNDSKAKVLYVSQQNLFIKVMLIMHELPHLETVIYKDLKENENFDADKRVISYDAFRKIGRKSEEVIETVTHPDDVATIIYTSGTTAVPKGVMLSHHSLLLNAEAAATVMPLSETDTLLSFLPLSHIFERTAGYYAPMLCRGSAIAHAEGVKQLKQNLLEVRPTVLVSVPRVYEKLHRSIWEGLKQKGKLSHRLFIWALKQEKGTFKHIIADRVIFKKIRAKLGGKIKFTISGGASLNHKLVRFFSRIGVPIYEGYGLTETAPVITVNRPGAVKPGTVGQKLPGVELQINHDKEILTRGPMVMKGYYRNPALTDEVIDKEGWFHTGDLGYIDEEGYLTVIGRKKEMISLANGKIAWPEQLESLLNNDRYISQSAVFGDGRGYLVALIIPDWQDVPRELERRGVEVGEPDEMIGTPQLRAFIAERIEKINRQLADWECIRNFYIPSMEGFSQEKDELTPTLKLRRRVVEQHYQSQIEKMYNQPHRGY